MWKLFEEYKTRVKSHPVLVQEFVGKNGRKVYGEREAPLTMEGFENYVADHPRMPWTLDQYFSNRGGAFDEFVAICSRIRREIREDQIKGGMVGIYNPSITQRLNGLADKTENKMDVDIKQITGMEIK